MVAFREKRPFATNLAARPLPVAGVNEPLVKETLKDDGRSHSHEHDSAKMTMTPRKKLTLKNHWNGFRHGH